MEENNKKSRLKTLLSLFLTFMKIGGFTFGGGYAMIPLIQKEAVDGKHWISDDDILEIVAIAESTPGPVAINAATFVGYRVCGFFGAFFATFGVVLPSFLIIVAISFVLTAFEKAKVVQYAFFGIRAGVVALILKALVGMYKKCPKNVVSYIVMALSFVAAAILNINIFIVIIGCGLFGLISSLIARRKIK